LLFNYISHDIGTPKAELPYLLRSSNQERNNPPMKEGMNQFRAV